MNYLRVQHIHPDNELISQRNLADILGVSRRTIERAIESDRIETFENTKGVKKLHPKISVQQFNQNKITSKVSTPTRGQKKAGMSGEDAQAVAHLPLTNPGSDPNLTDQIVTGEKRELALSRAQKEKHQSRLLELKVLEQEGTLVNKFIFFQKAYSLMASIKDKFNGMAPKIAPQIASSVEDALIESGMDPKKVREVMTKSKLEHLIREAIRSGVVESLREVSTTPLEEIIHD